jgi:hypothetical protein
MVAVFIAVPARPADSVARITPICTTDMVTVSAPKLKHREGPCERSLPTHSRCPLIQGKTKLQLF